MITVLTQRILKFGTIALTKQRKRVLGPKLSEPTIYYFAYGANLDPKRFARYEMNVQPVGVAKLEGYGLAFSLPCEYIGKGYASIEPSKDKTVWGYLYKVDRLALSLIDIMEYAFLRHYKRIAAAVKTSAGSECKAQVYVTGFPTQGLIPSTEYKTKILEAAIQHNFPAEYIDEIRNSPSKDSFELDPGFSLTLPSRRRPFERLLRQPYLMHDRIREVLCEKLRF